MKILDFCYSETQNSCNSAPPSLLFSSSCQTIVHIQLDMKALVNQGKISPHITPVSENIQGKLDSAITEWQWKVFNYEYNVGTPFSRSICKQSSTNMKIVFALHERHKKRANNLISNMQHLRRIELIFHNFGEPQYFQSTKYNIVTSKEKNKNTKV